MKRAMKAAAFDQKNVYLASSIPQGSISTRRRVIRMQLVKLKK